MEGEKYTTTTKKKKRQGWLWNITRQRGGKGISGKGNISHCNQKEYNRQKEVSGYTKVCVQNGHKK